MVVKTRILSMSFDNGCWNGFNLAVHPYLLRLLQGCCGDSTIAAGWSAGSRKTSSDAIPNKRRVPCRGKTSRTRSLVS